MEGGERSEVDFDERDVQCGKAVHIWKEMLGSQAETKIKSFEGLALPVVSYLFEKHMTDGKSDLTGKVKKPAIFIKK